MNILKKILTVGIFSLSLPVTSVLAMQASVYINPGVSYITLNSSISTSPEATITNPRPASHPLVRYYGFMPKISLGADMVTRPIGGFYLGAEFVAMPLRALTINNTPLETNTAYGEQSGGSFRPYWLYALDVLPGASLDYWVKVYARFGGARANFKTMNEVRNGYRLGAGLEWNLNCTWALRADYIHTTFTNIPNAGTPKMDEITASVMIRFFSNYIT